MISESVAFSASKLVDHKQRSLVNFSGIDGDDDETGDLTKKVDVDKALDGADCVLHLASYGFPSLVNLLAKMLSWLSGSLKEVVEEIHEIKVVGVKESISPEREPYCAKQLIPQSKVQVSFLEPSHRLHSDIGVSQCYGAVHLGDE
ncbi:PREDICTED: uncharacterized protein LOC104761770 isoform X5 [Camelina sativa]|uniref:Uncharacterized protein LOC104761770 isoform X5 n=1 Tax=Camelina sativa TaxID=90675 RepID=A0ABM1R8R0_CAMSA|nr:PREDICTED: uncharacterized protein LOC104761770 isoform X5 [Camelina sativa]